MTTQANYRDTAPTQAPADSRVWDLLNGLTPLRTDERGTRTVRMTSATEVALDLAVTSDNLAGHRHTRGQFVWAGVSARGAWHYDPRVWLLWFTPR